jgi:hypothetical protein
MRSTIWMTTSCLAFYPDKSHPPPPPPKDKARVSASQHISLRIYVLITHPVPDNTIKYIDILIPEYVHSVYIVQYTAKNQYRKFETNIPSKGIARPLSQFPHSCLWAIYILSPSVWLSWRKQGIWRIFPDFTSLARMPRIRALPAKLKVHKRENFFGSDFEFYTFL